MVIVDPEVHSTNLMAFLRKKSAAALMETHYRRNQAIALNSADGPIL
jgi:hypothetical protein